jgi:tetrahydromethanopterin S-methyltransferase subunit B
VESVTILNRVPDQNGVLSVEGFFKNSNVGMLFTVTILNRVPDQNGVLSVEGFFKNSNVGMLFTDCSFFIDDASRAVLLV